MPLRKLLDRSAFSDNEVAAISAAYEEVLRRLNVARGSNPTGEESIAQKVFAVATSGEVETQRIVTETMRQLLI